MSEWFVSQSIASTIQRNDVIDTLGHRRLDRLKVALILGGRAGDRVILGHTAPRLRTTQVLSRPSREVGQHKSRIPNVPLASHAGGIDELRIPQRHSRACCCRPPDPSFTSAYNLAQTLEAGDAHDPVFGQAGRRKPPIGYLRRSRCRCSRTRWGRRVGRAGGSTTRRPGT
jgi:hypothetical protein